MTRAEETARASRAARAAAARVERLDRALSAQRLTFFDSAGGAWDTCALGVPGAEAFGPRGAARRAERNEDTLHTAQGSFLAPANGNLSDYAACHRAGVVAETEDGWSVVIAPRLPDPRGSASGMGTGR